MAFCCRESRNQERSRPILMLREKADKAMYGPFSSSGIIVSAEKQIRMEIFKAALYAVSKKPR